jgi:hypothetical protein
MFSRSGFGKEHARRERGPAVIPDKWRGVVHFFAGAIALALLTKIEAAK